MTSKKLIQIQQLSIMLKYLLLFVVFFVVSLQSQAASQKLDALGGIGIASNFDADLRDLHLAELSYMFDNGEFLEVVAFSEVYVKEQAIVMDDRLKLLLASSYLELGFQGKALELCLSMNEKNFSWNRKKCDWGKLLPIYYGAYGLSEAINLLDEVIHDKSLANQIGYELYFAEKNYSAAYSRLSELVQYLGDKAVVEKYNLAVISKLIGDNENAKNIFYELIGTRVDKEELHYVKDSASLMLAAILLEEEEFEPALQSLNHVRLNSPLSEKALLLDSQIEIKQGNYSAAVISMLELRNRSFVDTSVHESFVTLPLVLVRSGAFDTAIQLYQEGLGLYEELLIQINEDLELSSGAGLVNLLEKINYRQDPSLLWRLGNNAKYPDLLMLRSLLSSAEFKSKLMKLSRLTKIEGYLASLEESLNKSLAYMAHRKNSKDDLVPLVKNELNLLPVDEVKVSLANLVNFYDLARFNDTDNDFALDSIYASVNGYKSSLDLNYQVLVENFGDAFQEEKGSYQELLAAITFSKAKLVALKKVAADSVYSSVQEELINLKNEIVDLSKAATYGLAEAYDTQMVMQESLLDKRQKNNLEAESVAIDKSELSEDEVGSDYQTSVTNEREVSNNQDDEDGSLSSEDNPGIGSANE